MIFREGKTIQKCFQDYIIFVTFIIDLENNKYAILLRYVLVYPFTINISVFNFLLFPVHILL